MSLRCGACITLDGQIVTAVKRLIPDYGHTSRNCDTGQIDITTECTGVDTRHIVWNDSLSGSGLPVDENAIYRDKLVFLLLCLLPHCFRKHIDADARHTVRNYV